MNKNQNIRFNIDKESDIMAWESLHSKDVGKDLSHKTGS